MNTCLLLQMIVYASRTNMLAETLTASQNKNKKRKAHTQISSSDEERDTVKRRKKKLYGRCHTDGCETTANWGKEGTKTRTHCAQCCKNLEGYVDLKTRKCPCGISMRNCTKCNPLEVLLPRKTRCNGCACWINGTTRTEYCAKCEPNAKKRPEHITWKLIKGKLPKADIHPDDKRALAGTNEMYKKMCNVEGKVLPDIMWVFEDRIISIEIDEHSHCDREVSCELKKVDETRFGTIVSDEGHSLPLIVLRFNPSAYDGARLTTEYKHQKLVERFKYHKNAPIGNYQPNQGNVEFLFYHSNAQKHIDAAKKSLNVVGVITK